MAASAPRRLSLLVASAAAALLALLAVVFWPPEPPSGAPDLRSLTSLGLSSEWDRAYWTGKARESDLVWSLAVALCDDAELSGRPNCRVVLDVAEQAAAEALGLGSGRGESR